jgi:hypothetical protein
MPLFGLGLSASETDISPTYIGLELSLAWLFRPVLLLTRVISFQGSENLSNPFMQKHEVWRITSHSGDTGTHTTLTTALLIIRCPLRSSCHPPLNSKMIPNTEIKENLKPITSFPLIQISRLLKRISAAGFGLFIVWKIKFFGRPSPSFNLISKFDNKVIKINLIS